MLTAEQRYWQAMRKARIIRMFSGELDGDIEPCHISFRAAAVRHSISELFREREGRVLNNNAKAMWRRAQKAGWRVVPVLVTRATSFHT